MSVQERLRDRYPTFFAYGSRQSFLDTESAIAATVEDRIRSVWPFIVRRAVWFSSTLKPRERVNFDPEDLVTELWATLAEKDALWSPAKGKYITFAGVVIDRALSAIRDKARTVHAPRNSSWRMKQYREEEAAGTLTDRRRRTAADIQRTSKVAGSIGSRGATDEDGCACEPVTLADPLAAFMRKETADVLRSGLREAMERLDPFDAHIVARLAGLGGVEAKTLQELATEVGREESEVRRADRRARLKIRKYLSSTRHAPFPERN